MTDPTKDPKAQEGEMQKSLTTPLAVALFQINRTIETGYASKLYIEEAKALKAALTSKTEEVEKLTAQIQNEWGPSVRDLREKLTQREAELSLARAALEAAHKELIDAVYEDSVALREKIEEALKTLSPEGEEKGCMCGEPLSSGVIHRTDGPCYHEEQTKEKRP